MITLAKPDDPTLNCESSALLYRANVKPVVRMNGHCPLMVKFEFRVEDE